MINDENFIGNVTTIFKMLSMTLAGWILGYAVSKGLNLPIDTTTLSEIIFMLLMFIMSYLDAKNPNSFRWLGNAPSVNVEVEEDLINPEYED